MTKLKKNFLTGLVSLLPTVATFYVIILFYKIINNFINLIVPVEGLVSFIVKYYTGSGNIEVVVAFAISLVSIVLMGLFIFIIGFAINTSINRGAIHFFEGMILKIPLAKSIYSSFKQLRDLLFSKNNDAYKKTVVIEYPKKGLYSLALVTKENNKNVEKIINQGEMYNVFISTAPNPTSGFYLIVKKSDCIELDVSVEETFKSIISVGAINPKTRNRRN